jgi:hypothetical protein
MGYLKADADDRIDEVKARIDERLDSGPPFRFL